MDTYLARIFPGFYHGRVYKPRSQYLTLSHNMNPFYTFTHLWYQITFNTTLPVRRSGRTCRVTLERATLRSVFSSHRVCWMFASKECIKQQTDTWFAYFHHCMGFI